MIPSTPPPLDRLPLTDQVLAQHATHMPDIVVYQHGEGEWWLAPLDDSLPLIRLNRAGVDLLACMDGTTTVAALLEKFGDTVCGTQGETGRWYLEHWATARFSLCYFGTEAPTRDRGETRWDLLQQQARLTLSGRPTFEGEEHLAQFHTQHIATADHHFDVIETTVSHLFREPSEALDGYTYGRRLGQALRKLGWWDRTPLTIMEVGGGLGYIAQELAAELSPRERQDIRYIFVDLARPFLQTQREKSVHAGWSVMSIQGNGEWLPLQDATVDIIIDNENMADMTPVQLTKEEVLSSRGTTPQHQEALDWIKHVGFLLGENIPSEFIVNLGPLRFLREVWRVLKPGGRAILVEFGIEKGLAAPVKLPGHTEYEVQFTHLRAAARWLGFQEHYGTLPHFLSIKPATQVLCTGSAYAIRRFCEAEGKPFSIRAYTESELQASLGPMTEQLIGHHYHEILDPAWFGLYDFKVLLLEKPGTRAQRTPTPNVRDVKGFRWGRMG